MCQVEPGGLVEVFTGNGRGKTLAATGLVLRAVGQGLKACVIYFLKGPYPYGEQKGLTLLPHVTFTRFGHEHFIDPDNITEEEREQAREALKAAREAVTSGQYDLVILDEVNIAVAWKLLELDDVVSLISDKPEKVELVLTGRHADAKLIEMADLVTEMVEIKHPYAKGVLARRGIDY